MKHSPYNLLFYGNVVNEPNKAAVELANRILNGLIRRGSRSAGKESADGKKIVEYKVKYSSLIRDCPQFSFQLDAILQSDSPTKSQTYNSKLKNVFTSAFRIIEEKSEARKKFINLKLPIVYKTVKGKKKKCYEVRVGTS